MEEPSTSNNEASADNENEISTCHCYKKPMHIAVMKGDIKTIVTLAEYGVKVSQVENGQTPLHLALIRGKLLAARKLISLGADLSIRNKDGFTPLHLAVIHDCVSLIDYLIDTESECDVNAFDENGNTALHIAVLLGKINAIHALLIRGADADFPNREVNAPLHIAIIQGNSDVLDIVLQYVTKPNILDKDELRPLHLAVLHNQIDAIPKIGCLDNIKVNYLNGDGDSALHLATKLGNLEAIAELYYLGANLNLKNSKGYSPIHLAVLHNKLTVIDTLVHCGARIDAADRHRNTPVHLAVMKKNIAALRLICYLRANINLRNSYGDAPLHSAIMSDCIHAVKVLLEFEANIIILNAKGMTPLHIAVCLGNKDIIETLIQYGASVHCVDVNGNSPLHSAAKFCNSIGIKTLIINGAGLNVQNKDDLTPMDCVMQYVKENTFKTATKAVADLYKKRNIKRRSPLSTHKILKCVKLLLKIEILGHFEHSKLNEPKYLSNIIPIVRNYINNSFFEVKLMKSTLLHEKLSFFEFVMSGWVDAMPLTCANASEVALNHILDVSTTKGYPVYRDIIISKLERPALLNKALYLRMHARHNGRTIFLDLDTVPLIVKQLSNADILNLLLAYSGVNLDNDVSESLNKLQESKHNSSSVEEKPAKVSKTTGSKKIQLSNNSLKNSVKNNKKKCISVATKSAKTKRALSSKKTAKGNHSPHSIKVSRKNYNSSVIKTAKEKHSTRSTKSKKGKGCHLNSTSSIRKRNSFNLKNKIKN
ncbi:ankyrin-3-like [Argiope bruennichi]|uniref:ankyrin-3-like n=1 Tax=Argiope bruennichi TaxID=94029 RepID=UPI0024956A49|nr:ankyrin-3-like [Argiope bruennichi]